MELGVRAEKSVNTLAVVRVISDGAKLVESAQDVLEELGVPGAKAIDAPTRLAQETSATDERLLALMGHDPVDLDTLAQRSARAPSELAAALLELELAQHIERLPGNKYQRLR